MPRILLLLTDLEIGGTPTVVRELAIRLRRGMPRGGEVHVACLGDWGPVAYQIQDAGIPVTPLGAKSARDVLVVARLGGLIREHGIGVVFSFLVHANAAAAAVAMFEKDVRYIQSIQTTQPRPAWHWKVQRWAAKKAEKIVVPSESVAQVARQWAEVPSGKIVVIPNAVEMAEFQRVSLPPCDTRPFPIGFIGRLDPIKCVPDLLEAVYQLAGMVHLHIFGDGPERGAIQRLIADLAIPHLVTMHGAVARPQEALARIGVLVLPSEAEGFGLVLIEAMASGVPVVATNVAGIRDVVRDGETGLLVRHSAPQEMAAAIQRVIIEPGLAEGLIERGLVDVRERFSWEEILPRYQRLLDSAPP